MQPQYHCYGCSINTTDFPIVKVYVTDFPVVKVHVWQHKIVCDIVRKRKYKLPASKQSILPYLYS